MKKQLNTKNMTVEDFSKKDKFKIAEFLYAMETDTLIKSEGQAVIDLFMAHKVERAKTTKLETISIFMLIKEYFDVIDRQELMKDYFSGKLG